MVECVPDNFRGEASIIYRSGDGVSPTLDRLAEETGKAWTLTVDYRTVVEMSYYGTTEPQERTYEEQINDWQSGYMWGRFQVNANCEKDPYGGYYYWVCYPAVLREEGADMTKYIIAAVFIGLITYLIFRSLKKGVS